MDEGAGKVEFDLLGDPVQPIRDPRGRPAYAKTKENQLLVITLRGASWTEADIATYMQCDPKTLRKHFSRELDAGALFLEGMAMQVLVNRMLLGNVGAAKSVREIAAGRLPKGQAVKAARLGKKDVQKAEAGVPTKGWGDILSPPGQSLN